MNTSQLLMRLLWAMACLFCFQACDDEEGILLMKESVYGNGEILREPVSEINLTHISTFGLHIEGGEAPYNAVSHNEQVVRASIANNRLQLEGVGAGTTEIVVTDSHQEFATLQVHVSQATRSMQVGNVLARIEGFEENSNPELYGEICETIIHEARYRTDMTMDITLERREDGIGGPMTVQLPEAPAPVEGYYTQAYNTELERWEHIFDWNGQADTFVIPAYLLTSRDVGPTRIILVQDVTADFQRKHPEYTQVTKAELGLEITSIQN